MRALTRGLVLAVFLGGLFTAPTPPRAGDTLDSPQTLSTLEGQGPGHVAMCFGCAATLIGVGGATWGGLMVLSFFHADAIVACAYICYGAFQE